jgi:hypothetical protein
MDYISALKQAIGKEHGCDAHLERQVPVAETRLGEIAWEGDVAVFRLEGHPRAKRCYAWGVPDDDEAESREVTTVLEVPPVQSAETAVRAYLARRNGSG